MLKTLPTWDQIPKFNKEASCRALNGMILLDKPSGMTSNAALQIVKRGLGAKKAGHTGSLDPLACGMLPICLGEATKFTQFLLEADKEYVVVARLGIKTTTGDAEGDVLEEKEVKQYPPHEVKSILQLFQGKIMQIPSMYSALKYKGKPMYKLARQGIEIERKAREVNIYKLALLDKNENTLTLEVRCSKGTYIRTLVEDIGEALGCGAHVTYLRRLSVGDFYEHQMVRFADLEKSESEEFMLPIDRIVSLFPEIHLSKVAAFYIIRGQSVMIPNHQASGYVRLYDHNHQFMGVGEILDNGKVTPRRLVKAN